MVQRRHLSPAERESFGKLIKQARNARDWSQKELAAKLGISRTVVNNIESGVSTPSDVVSAAIANVLNLPQESIGTVPSIAFPHAARERPAHDPTSPQTVEALVNWFNVFARRSQRNVEIACRLRMLAVRMAEAYELGDDFLVGIADELMEQTEAAYGGCALGSLDIPAKSDIERWRRLLELANNSILATSCLAPSKWWGTAEGRWYHKANIRKVEAKKSKGEPFAAERIFVFASREEAKETSIRTIVSEQLDVGIKIWIGFTDKDEFPADKALDFYVIDDSYVGSLHLQNRTEWQHGTFSVNPNAVRRYFLLFQDMKWFAHPVSNRNDLDEILNGQHQQ